ncbi:MAG TPA: family 1 glycosylhydrolase [Polyangiaceae bacterium]|nr:family 1 glycosylhydrolase [Polyangiaceae bacterium]
MLHHAAVGGSLELWGGVECTVNRVGHRYHDQLRFAGHGSRPDDLEAIASLGVKALRYPVLWEHVAPRALTQARFDRTDRQLAALRRLRVEPIVGLLHHGSGPRYTSLLDPAFPNKLASYASRVARRYPWLERFTPVNEPLTTARFSALYGHWYPHARDDRSFARALFNQVRGSALAMQAIRREIPGAKLVQTEDLGVVRSTPDLAEQAQFENHRRFLSLELLMGRVTRHHPLFDYLRGAGLTERELALLADEPCVPDVVGFNYYVTSERFLDSRVELYPSHVIGGNGERQYADVEAVRVCRDGLSGPAALLREAHERLGLTLAITEAHLAGCPEDRARWFSYVWTAAEAARQSGVPVVAVTAWALFGSYGWDHLVTRGACSYEPGAFQVRNRRRIETPYAGFLRAIAGGTARVVDGGWWRHDERLLYRHTDALTGTSLASADSEQSVVESCLARL